MRDLQRAVDEFLACRRIAVVGMSRAGDSPANLIYRKLRETGHTVFGVNPNAATVDGEACYPTLAAIPGGVDAVMIVTAPAVTARVVDECAALGIGRVWIHRSFGSGSVSAEAVERCRRHGIAVIPGGCPMMHLAPVDPGHRCIRGMLRLVGKLPVPLPAASAAAAHPAA